MRYFPINRCASGCSAFDTCPHAAHTFSLRQPSGDHGPGARDSQSRHHHASGQEGRLFEKDSPHGCGNVDPAVWTVRRLYALRVPGALNLNPNAARFTFMSHLPVRHPTGDLRSCKSAILPICHMLFLDGVYVDRLDGSARFRWVSSPTTQELTQLSQTIARRVGRYLERQGLLEQDAENSYLTTDAVPGGSMDHLLGHSMT